MEDVSPIGAPVRHAVTIPNEAGLQDHRFLGQAVLPAVYAQEHLAGAVKRVFPDVPLTVLTDARFDKFMALPGLDTPLVDAVAEMKPCPDGGIEALLLTRHVAPKSGIARMKTHVRTCFSAPVDANRSLKRPPPWPGGHDDFQMSAEQLYAGLVPFGSTFHNIVSTVHLRPESARAIVSGGTAGPEGPGRLLGSPFPLDAVFHLACAWAQRYAGVVAFPTGMDQRFIRRPTLPAERYAALVRFRRQVKDRLLFDLWLHDQDGHLCEFIRGLAMRDVSGGKLQPPEWVRG
jgi:hypothetical protein